MNLEEYVTHAYYVQEEPIDPCSKCGGWVRKGDATRYSKHKQTCVDYDGLPYAGNAYYEPPRPNYFYTLAEDEEAW